MNALLAAIFSKGSITIVDGDKGGVGKSFLARLLGDWMLTRGLSVLAVDADQRNPDFYRVFAALTESRFVNLRADEGNGFADIIDLMDKSETPVNILISMPAGIGEQQDRYGAVFVEALAQLGVPINWFWVINNERDSTNLLRHQLENGGMKDATSLFVVRNLFFGTEDKFGDYNNSNTRRMVHESGKGLTIDMPKMKTDIVAALAKENMTLTRAIAQNKLRLFDRVEGQKWCESMFGTLDALTKSPTGARLCLAAPEAEQTATA